MLGKRGTDPDRLLDGVGELRRMSGGERHDRDVGITVDTRCRHEANGSVGIDDDA